MTPHGSPVFSSIQHKGYWYQPKCHTNTTIASTISVYDVQSPRSIVVYLISSPDLGVGSIVTNQTILKNKENKHKKKSNNELFLRYTPLINSPAESPVL